MDAWRILLSFRSKQKTQGKAIASRISLRPTINLLITHSDAWPFSNRERNMTANMQFIYDYKTIYSETARTIYTGPTCVCMENPHIWAPIYALSGLHTFIAHIMGKTTLPRCASISGSRVLGLWITIFYPESAKTGVQLPPICCNKILAQEAEERWKPSSVCVCRSVGRSVWI